MGPTPVDMKIKPLHRINRHGNTQKQERAAKNVEKESRGRGKHKEERRVKGATDITERERENRKGTDDSVKKKKK